ncbi:MAG: hypothetical protein KY432_06650, partial [Acidobacteria bacterium]|nr:hypothetical protein [Acidobacteriota bacterium]
LRVLRTHYDDVVEVRCRKVPVNQKRARHPFRSGEFRNGILRLLALPGLGNRGPWNNADEDEQ